MDQSRRKSIQRPMTPHPLVPPSPPVARGVHLRETYQLVLLPAILGFWGLLVYARYGYVIGQIGVAGLLALMTPTYAVIGLTIMSVAAITSNGLCRGSGPYYLISRNLGPEFGGSIGLSRIVGNCLTVLLNVAVLVDLFADPLYRLVVSAGAWGEELPRYWTFLCGCAINAIATIICLLQNHQIARYNVLFATIVAAAGVALVHEVWHAPKDSFDPRQGWMWTRLAENWGPDGSISSDVLVTSLALLFPCSGGLLAGTSGLRQLRMPGRSVHRGLLTSAALSLVLYVALAVYFAGCVPRDMLQSNPHVLADLAPVPVIVSVAALALQSMLNSISSAAGMLHDMVVDRILFPGAETRLRAFAPRRSQQYRLATLLVAAGVQAGLCLVHRLDHAALLVTMSTLITFCAINLACFLLQVSSAPNFRPLARGFSWQTALAGAILAAVAMVLISPTYTAVSLAFCAVCFAGVHYAADPQPWGDVTQALIYHQVRKYLLQLDQGRPHVKLWRPQILLLVRSPASSYTLVKFMNDLKKGALFVIGHVQQCDFRDGAPTIERSMAAWSRLMQACHVKAFPQVAVHSSLRTGCQQLMTTVGLGGMRPNLVVLGDLHQHGPLDERPTTVKQVAVEQLDDPVLDHLPDSRHGAPVDPQDYVGILEDALALGRAVGIAVGFERLGRTGGRTASPGFSRNRVNGRPRHSLQEFPRYADDQRLLRNARGPVPLATWVWEATTSWVASWVQRRAVNRHVDDRRLQRRIFDFVFGSNDERWRFARNHTSLFGPATVPSSSSPRASFQHLPWSMPLPPVSTAQADPENPSSPAASSTASSTRSSQKQDKRFIDIWPIALPSYAAESVAVTSDAEPGNLASSGTAVLSAVSAYTLSIQLGCILHMVRHWKQQYDLRVLSFVEHADQVSAEEQHLAALLESLRIRACVKVVALLGPRSRSPPPNAIRADYGASATYSKLYTSSTCASHRSEPLTVVSEPISATSSTPMPTSRSMVAASDLGHDARSIYCSASSTLTRFTRELETNLESTDGDSTVYDDDLDDSQPLLPPSPSPLPVLATDQLPQSLFRYLPARTQYQIINELMRAYSGSETTELCITTLPAPEPLTSASLSMTTSYLKDVSTLAFQTVPTLFVHGRMLTVSTTL